MKRELRRAAVLGLSAGLVLTSLSGCSKNKMNLKEAAVTVNDEELSLGVLNFAVRYDQAGLETAYTSFGIQDPFSQDLFGSGETLGQMAVEQDVEMLTHAMLAEQKMEEYGVSISDDDKASITAAATAFIEANDEGTLEEIGATQEIVERFLELQMIQHRMEPEMSADVDTEVSDEEAAQRKIEYVLFTPVTEEESETESESEVFTPAETEQSAETESEAITEAETESESSQEEASLVKETATFTTAADETEEDATEAETTAAETEAETETETEDPETAEAMAKALAQAEEFLAKVQDGEDFGTAAEELGKTASEATLDADYYVAEIAEATEGVADDTLIETPIKTDSGYYVVHVISQFDREATDTKKEEIVEQRKSDRIAELYDEWAEDGEVTQNAEAIAQIVFDYSLTTPAEPETEAQTDLTPAETEDAAEAAVTPAETEAQTEAQTDVTPAETEE